MEMSKVSRVSILFIRSTFYDRMRLACLSLICSANSLREETMRSLHFKAVGPIRRVSHVKSLDVLGSILLGLAMALVIPIQSAYAQAVYGPVGYMTAGPGQAYFGVSGGNTISDPSVAYKWVNSIYVREYANNGVEIGWAESPNNTRFAFAVRMYNGSYSEQPLPPVMNVGTNHVFRIQSREIPSGYLWDYYVDGRVEWGYTHWRSNWSQVWAALERDGSSTGANSHFWGLAYGTYTGLQVPWNSMQTSDGDPSYNPCKVSNIELWIKPSCP